MKNLKLLTIVTVAFFFLFSVLFGCGGKKMSDEDFQKITSEVISESMKSGFEQSITNPDEYSEKYNQILEDVCKKYGYSVSDYEKKAEEVLKDLKLK